MGQALRTDLLLQSVGISVENQKGEPMGKIVEAIRSRDEKNIEYVILESDIFFGEKDRFFAVPASTALIKITRGGKLILQASKNDLQQAKGITLEQCPRPNFKFEPTIFELFQYQAPVIRTESATSSMQKTTNTKKITTNE